MLNLKYHVILGSQSPRRKQLLSALIEGFEVRVKETAEVFPEELKAAEIAEYLAALKANVFKSELHDNDLIITSDTIVWLDDMLLGKPANEADSFRMLKLLSGRMHEVFTGVCLLSKEKHEVFSVRSEVYFRPLTDEEIKNYILHFRPFDKAGSYGAQDFLPEGMNPCSEEEKTFLKKIGKEDLFDRTRNHQAGALHSIQGIEKINGSYFNVMGLPIAELEAALRTF